MFRQLPRKGATAFVNHDDARVVRSVPRGVRKVTYGMMRGATFRGRIVKYAASHCAVLEITGGAIRKPLRITLGVPGDHMPGMRWRRRRWGQPFACLRRRSKRRLRHSGRRVNGWKS